MPLIDVTYDGSVDEEVLRRLGELLPAVVGEAVECPEEPWTGPEQPGDIEIRFRKKSPARHRAQHPETSRNHPEGTAASRAVVITLGAA
ncbi:MAG TPA: hypothetical protein VGF54_10950 [Streptosporangiaceae bacterium]|jgi:hypothetical protein